MRAVEWPTILVLGLTYLAWVVGLFWISNVSTLLAIFIVAWAIAQYSSLQHEVIHGHPFKIQWLNEALVAPALNPTVPYARFRETHLAHHKDARLTDPFDDPESNYLDQADWLALPNVVQRILNFNNTLMGRLLLGPMIGMVFFLLAELRAARGPEGRRVLKAWGWHGLSLGFVLIIVGQAPMPLWSYLASCYLALSLLKIRTFLEHQAHESARGRTVVIADRGPLALLFLNNNYHVVHHMHPNVPWYLLPGVFRANAKHYLRVNHGYYFENYREVVSRYFWTAKDDVAHPLWRRGMQPETTSDTPAREPLHELT
ncbi:MAG: fatty acid desaturase [Pseudomonadota bacterium]